MADSGVVFTVSAQDKGFPELEARVSKALNTLTKNFQATGTSQAEAATQAKGFEAGLTKLAQAQAQTRIDKLATDIGNVGKQANPLASIFNKLSGELGKVGNIAVGTAIGSLGANLAMGLAERVQAAAEQIDTFGTAVWKIQVVTGETAENASTLAGIFQRFGLNGDEAASKLSRFERALNGTDTALDLTESGGKRGAQILSDLGVQTQDAAGKVLPLSDVLLNLAGRWTQLDAASKNAAARSLFGGLGGAGGEQLNLLLSQGRAGLEAIAEAQRKYGLSVTQDNVEDVKRFTYAHKDLDIALQGVALQFGAAFMPAVTEGARVAADFAQILNQLILPAIQAIPAALPALTVGIGVLLAGAAAQATLQMARFAATGLAAVATAIPRVALALVGTLAPAFATEAGAALGAAAATVAAWLAAASPVILIIGAIALAVGALVLLWQGKFAQAGEMIGDAVNKIKTIVGNAAKAMTTDVFAAGQETGDAYGAGIETSEQKVTKAAKAVADKALKQLQDAAAQRKDDFDLGEIDKETTVLQAKLDQMGADQAMLGYKRQMEDLDSNAVDFALKRRQLDEEDAVTQAKIAEDKLRAQADDLSYQEKLLMAQARAAKMRGEDVDMGALRDKILTIRKQQIQDEPGLLIAEHNTATADRAKQATDLNATLQKDALERQKLAIQEAMKPFQDAATAAKRAYEDAQAVVELDKVRFDLAEQAHKAELITAQAAAKAADEAYQAATAAADAARNVFAPNAGGTATPAPASDINPQGGVGNQPYGPGNPDTYTTLPPGMTMNPNHLPLPAPPNDGGFKWTVPPSMTDPNHMPIHARAGGGPVGMGGLYLVGENGPELFAPRSSGTILPSGFGSGSGGATTISLSINQQNTVRSDDDIEGIAQRSAVASLEMLHAAFRVVNQPARPSLPGAYAGGLA